PVWKFKHERFCAVASRSLRHESSKKPGRAYVKKGVSDGAVRAVLPDDAMRHEDQLPGSPAYPELLRKRA
ncbi:hypothetical protein ACPPTR_16085, partial [Ralstonia pseudosolanacearum]|uniref:hypothetical protein n=1 Tax=Ralstonia pseudosolanacearum TaxID=1310165 RepID=UPI003C7D3913